MSRDTGTTVDTSHSLYGKDGSRFAPFGCAGAPRDKGTDKRAIGNFTDVFKPNFGVSSLYSNLVDARSFAQCLGADGFTLPNRGIAGPDSWTRDGGLSGTANPSDFCWVVLTEVVADVGSLVGIVSDIPVESIQVSPDGRLVHFLPLARTAARDERCSGVEESYELFPLGRSGGTLRCWKSSHFAKVKQVIATRHSHFAWSCYKHQLYSSALHTNLRSHFKLQSTSSTDLSTLPKYVARVGHRSEWAEELTLTGERVGSGQTSGNDENEAHRVFSHGGGLGGSPPPPFAQPLSRRLGWHAPVRRVSHTLHE